MPGRGLPPCLVPAVPALLPLEFAHRRQDEMPARFNAGVLEPLEQPVWRIELRRIDLGCSNDDALQG